MGFIFDLGYHLQTWADQTSMSTEETPAAPDVMNSFLASMFASERGAKKTHSARKFIYKGPDGDVTTVAYSNIGMNMTCND
jgi:hypothetical protein